LAQNIVETAAAATTAARAALKSFRSEAQALKNRFARPALMCAGTRAAAEARKALKARLALRIDLAAVELRALLVVADNLIGRVGLGKAGLRFRVLVRIRMMAFG